ncbi:putative tyrosinase-like protein tyr-3 [Mya arenaria]|uniref:putative tyrosinase-like protein tyr-3 n=1 Tax=Mya arenaria TaxID=6604 RepID=UPI0022E84A89|nr:putative tyrosinase-like protein tyr-3 [Mya arenaria]
MAAIAIASFILIFVSNSFATADFEYTLTLPEKVQECFDHSAHLSQVDHKLAKDACIRAYFADILEPSIREDDYLFFKTEFEDKRYGFLGPPTGFRRRSDIRTLSRRDRKAVFDAFEELYQNGILGRFGRVHGDQMFRKHKGRAFLPWHRVFLAAFEEEMRKTNPDVSLPYWDYTMDYYIPAPENSVVWSNCFFGNGYGIITSGPFEGWYGGLNNQIHRKLAERHGQCLPKLIHKADIKGLMDFCKYQEITTGEGDYYHGNPFNLELLHDGVHDWVGGDMEQVKYSGFDPVFWMHHAFIDLIWEQFRQHQQQSDCNIDPENDYPEVNLSQDNKDGHGPYDTMQAFEHLYNIDGMKNTWTTDFYSYEPQPHCPECGNSTYLYCDKRIDSIRFPNGVCVSKEISDCKERWRRNAPNPAPLHHTACDGKFLIMGMQGDGRDRNNTDAENRKILSDLIAHASNTSPDTCTSAGTGSSRRDIAMTFYFALAVLFIFN